MLSVSSFILSILSIPFGGFNDTVFNIDTSDTGKKIENKFSHMNLWDCSQIRKVNGYSGEADTSFVEYIELMTATGGNEERDLFINPLDRSTITDYNFAPLIEACRGVLSLGAKPLIKLGNVPLKLCSSPVISKSFGVNVCPPDDYNEYYTYIKAVINALVCEFGLEEVRSWRYGVLTEYENADWFCVGDNLADETAKAYCKLYDYTVQALIDVLGEEHVYVGAHSMTVTEGLWDEAIFIKHVASGTNYANNRKGSHIDYLAASFYDVKPGEYTSGYTLKKTIDYLRKNAEKCGLYGLDYGIDEGRILCGVSKGKDDNSLNRRMVGYSWQGAYDVRMLKTMLQNDINYFSVWSWTSGEIGTGYPTVSCHVANCFKKMVSGRLTECLKIRRSLYCGAETDAFASYSDDGKLCIMAYNYKNSLDYNKTCDMKFKIKVKELAGKTITLKKYIIDDSSNYFDDWCRDREACKIDNNCFSWSPDDPSIDCKITLNSDWACDLYKNELRNKYIECSKLNVSSEEITFDRFGKATVRFTAQPNSVVFFETENSAD